MKSQQSNDADAPQYGERLVTGNHGKIPDLHPTDRKDITPMTFNANLWASRLKEYINYREGDNNWNIFSTAFGRQHEPWCADYLCATAKWVGGYEYIGDHPYCPEWVNSFLNKGQWHWGGTGIRFGDVGFVADSHHIPAHVFFVLGNSSSYVNTIEGNTNIDGSSNGIGVFVRRRPLSSLYGYGRPVYPTHTDDKAFPPSRYYEASTRQTWSMPTFTRSTWVFQHVNQWVGTVQQGTRHFLAVAAVQGALDRRGYDLTIDGDCGPLTRGAILSYQHRSGLPSDGIVGPVTAVSMDLTTP